MRAETANGHTVAVVAYDEVALFEFSVACEIFGEPYERDVPVPWYRLLVCGAGPAGPRSVRTDRGLRIDVPHGLRALSTADTVVVPPNARFDAPDEVLRAIQRAHARGARLVSLCTGAFVLAAAGVLDGRRATTHWAECAELSRRYPSVRVDPDVLYIDDGDVLTSAGSAASIDLCLHIVRTDHGAQIAADLARDLVVAPYRDGGQAQYIRTPLPDPRTDELFTGTLAWLQEHLAAPVTVADLARRSAMSRRTFARRFVDSTGATPYQWLVRQRVQLAQRMLESTDEPLDVVAARTGFVTAGNLRKHFTRVVKTTPTAYRRAFATTEDALAG
jgi:AraC family transcriptional activator FtrA